MPVSVIQQIKSLPFDKADVAMGIDFDTYRLISALWGAEAKRAESRFC